MIISSPVNTAAATTQLREVFRKVTGKASSVREYKHFRILVQKAQNGKRRLLCGAPEIAKVSKCWLRDGLALAWVFRVQSLT
jgi:hypothetical protein